MLSDRYKNFEQLEIDYPADRVLRLTFNRPETYNSLDKTGHRQLTEIWRVIDEDPDISAVILTGAGKAFSSGGDFSMIRENIDDFHARTRAWKEASLR